MRDDDTGLLYDKTEIRRETPTCDDRIRPELRYDDLDDPVRRYHHQLLMVSAYEVLSLGLLQKVLGLCKTLLVEQVLWTVSYK